MILVTGGSGLLGTELISQLLAQGKELKAIYHRTPLKDFNSGNIQQLQCDILDVIRLEEVMQDVTELYHCAGMVSFLPKKAGELYKINAEGTANLVNAALNAGIKKLVHVSSVSALGRLREGELVNETMQWTPDTSNSEYGHSKYLGELEVWRGIAEGLNAVIINPTMILGAGNWDDGSTRLFKSAYDEFPWYTQGVTGFVDVRDVASAMIMLMGSDISAERFIISSENTGYRDLFNMIADEFNKNHPSKEATPLMAGIVWRWEALKSKFLARDPLITKETAVTAMAKVNFDNSKLKKRLPSFAYRSLQQSIGEICVALQQKLNNH